MAVSRSVHKAKSNGKSISEKFLEAAETVLSGSGMYSENNDGIFDDGSGNSEEESESTGSETPYSDSEGDEESVEVTYWTDQETNIMYEVLYDHERDQFYVENDNGVSIYFDDEGGIDAEMTDEVESMQASIQTLTNDHFPTITRQSSPFVTVMERRGSYRDRNHGWLNTIDFNPEELVLEENPGEKGVTVDSTAKTVTPVHRDEQQVEALMSIVAAEIFWKFPEWKISGNFRKFPTSFFIS